MTIIRGQYDKRQTARPPPGANFMVPKPRNMKPIIKIADLHADDQAWMSQMAFYEEELAELLDRLGEVSREHPYPNEEVLKKVDQFENKLRVQQMNLDRLRNQIQLNEARLAGSVLAGQEEAEEREFTQHAHDKKAITDFEENLNVLRAELRVFFARYL
jgi:hypothetical protein